MTELFTYNKQLVRELNYKYIQRKFSSRDNDLIYMGLPSSEMKDIIMWKKYIKEIYAIEIGREGEEYVRQHNIVITAFKEGLSNKLKLLRGDIDNIIINKVDTYLNPLVYPFDLINLDYCSGVVYRNNLQPKALRIEALRSLFEYQAEFSKDFMLFISVNLDHYKPEILKTLEGIRHSLNNLGKNGGIIDELIKHESEEVRLKVYIFYLISSLASNFYKVEFNKPIHYLGNNNTRMINFSFYLKFNTNTFAPRVNIHEITKIINTKLLQAKDGNITDSEYIIPLI